MQASIDNEIILLSFVKIQRLMELCCRQPLITKMCHIRVENKIWGKVEADFCTKYILDFYNNAVEQFELDFACFIAIRTRTEAFG